MRAHENVIYLAVPKYSHVDFTTQENPRACERVRQLRGLGLSDHAVADLVGWHVVDVRRAIAERPL